MNRKMGFVSRVAYLVRTSCLDLLCRLRTVCVIIGERARDREGKMDRGEESEKQRMCSWHDECSSDEVGNEDGKRGRRIGWRENRRVMIWLVITTRRV